MELLQRLSQELKVPKWQIESAVRLLDEGNTIPFIARYRKEATGGLSDVVLRDLDERLTYLRNLEERKEEVIRLIDEQGKLTEELESQIREAEVLIIGGTSLAVYPAAGLVNDYRGNKLTLINKGVTSMDWQADLVVSGPIGEILGAVQI